MECSVCLSELAQAHTLSCGHSYHRACLFDCNKASPLDCPVCPLCRAPVEQIQSGIAAVNRYKRFGCLMGDIPIMKTAADLGSAPCADVLASIFFMGSGVDKDDSMAEHYWKTADVYWTACSNLGALAFNRGNMAQSAEHFKKAIAINPGNPANYMKLATVLGDTPESTEAYLTAIAIYVDEPDKQAVIYLHLGDRAVRRGTPDSAFEYFSRGAELCPSNVAAHLNAARHCPDPEFAHTYVDAALRHEPNNVEAVCLKGQIYLREDNRRAADAMLARAREISPNSPMTGKLGDTLRQFGPLTRKRARVR